jgi:hypothetical protein
MTGVNQEVINVTVIVKTIPGMLHEHLYTPGHPLSVHLVSCLLVKQTFGCMANFDFQFYTAKK